MSKHHCQPTSYFVYLSYRESTWIDDSLIKEIIQHQSFCKQKSQGFYGRRQLLNKIVAHVDEEDEEECEEEEEEKKKNTKTKNDKDQEENKSQKEAEETKIKSLDNHPLIIHGKTGSGVSSVMAQAAKLLRKEFPDRIQVTRFVGCTPESKGLQHILSGICGQLQRAVTFDERGCGVAETV